MGRPHPDDYNEAARMFAGERALGYLDNALNQLDSIQDALAADLTEYRTSNLA
ncbi:hypothetical protein ACIGO9_14725 [Nocardia asteroides]|uniref:hypothetical protein n=1 Tax=Nocardia asteroides TaxID=1824 RepID=UPI0037CA6B97